MSEMAKKANTDPAVAAEPPVKDESKKDEPKDEDPPASIAQGSQPKAAEPKKDEPKAEPAKSGPEPRTDDDIAFVKAEFQKRLLADLDADTLRAFLSECEGKGLKAKAEWIEAHKKAAPKPDPTKKLPAGGAAPSRLYERNDVSNYFK